MREYKQTGYLNGNFKVFHLNEEVKQDIDFHYHDFHKILIFLKGNISYCIEGRNYDLSPNDIVFVHAGEVHRPIWQDASPYERIIIYISREFLGAYQQENNDLGLCLKQAHENQSHVLRVPAFQSTKLGNVIKELEASFHSTEYANELYHDILFLEFMVQLNRAVIREGVEYISTSSANPKIISIIDYMNAHLNEYLTIDRISETFYLNRYYLMHTFKEETGYTIGHYLTTKRLLMAKDLIDGGMPATEACYECGFRNYSTFYRAYKKNFNATPTGESSMNALPEYS